MIKRTVIISLFSTSLLLNVSAQTTDFDLSQYKLPDLRRNTLETDFNAYGGQKNLGQNYRENDSLLHYGNEVAEESKSHNVSFDGNLYFDHYRSTERLQRLLHVDLMYVSHNSVNKRNITGDSLNTQATYEYKNVNIDFNIDFENRMYITNRLFVSTDFVASYGLQFNSDKTNRDFKDSDNLVEDNWQRSRFDNSYAGMVPLKVGVGRIEQVQDARHAVYLFDELSKQGRISKQPTNEDILMFSEFISKLKNERFFDTRHQKIAELEAVDSFLVANNFVGTHDMRYFTTLEDFWTYGGMPIRESGTRLSFVVSPGYDSFESTTNQTDQSILLSDEYRKTIVSQLLYGGIELNHEKPLSLFVQNSIAANIYVGVCEGSVKGSSPLSDYLFGPQPNSDYNYTVPNIQFQYFHSIGYYPNTRTQLKAIGSFQWTYTSTGSEMDDQTVFVEGTACQAGLGFNMSYYLSPKLRILADAGLRYRWTTSETYMNYGFSDTPGYNVDLVTPAPPYDVNSTYSSYRLDVFDSYFSLGFKYSIF